MSIYISIKRKKYLVVFFEIIANAKILLAKQNFLLLESDVTQGFTHAFFTCTMAALGLGIAFKSLTQAVQVPVHFESFENTCNSCNTTKIDSGLSRGKAYSSTRRCTLSFLN